MAEETQLLDGIQAREIPGQFFAPGDKRVIGWVKEALDEGERVMKEDPAFPKIDAAMSYVLGEQITGPRPTYLPNVIMNVTKKAIRTHTAALTDIRPLFAYKVLNQAFEPQAHLLNNLIIMWWVNTFADLEVADTVKYSLAAGSGDTVVEWDPHFAQGDNRLLARDPRDTVPIRPSRSRSLQDWEGVIIREAHTVNKLRGMYPDRANEITESLSGRWGSVFTKFRRIVSMITPSSTLDGLRGSADRRASPVPEVILYRVYINDRTPHMGREPKLMGQPGTNWAYMVRPGEPLYPRKRLIVCTERAVLYDGPNQYWHGMFPVARLKLDSWPWQFLGLGLVHDLLPAQDAINMTVQDFLQTFSQAVNRGAAFDKNAVPEPVFKRFDSRKPNWKLKLNATMGDGFKLFDAPNLPPWSLEFLRLMFQQFENMSEMANLQQLMQLRQMPGAETIQKYMEALTPGLRLEARMLESYLREVAEMVKVNVFQFYSQARRVLLLGDAGHTLQDFDYDPDTLIPALAEGDPAYTPELDRNRPRDLRAQFFHKLFSFYVAPNSIIALHATEQQMKFVQLARQGYVDFWTLLQMLEVPNVGDPPPIPLPPRDWKPEIDPATGATKPPPLEVRVPQTITERLQAQQQLGIGQTVSPVGRKATGQAPPHVEQRTDGSTTIAESR